MKTQKRFYVTTAIDYVNSSPHIGQAYEKILADTIARFHRAIGCDTFFLTGTDEHSINIHRKALAQGKTPKQFCDEMSLQFKNLYSLLNVSYDRFIRTTDADHIETVQALVRKIYENGFLEIGQYEGHYCPSCEAFYTEEDLINGKCKIHDTIDVEWITEKNFFFKLSAFQGKLEKLIADQPLFIEPEIRKNEVLGMLARGLKNISISRESLEWGVPFPAEICAKSGLKPQVVYVWFDALINYVTGTGYLSPTGARKDFWPADVHVIGKDITFFHCIIWPAMLMAAGIPIQKKVLAHGFWLNKGRKVSKTAGNAIDPIEIANAYGVDALRFYLLSECYCGNDGNFSDETLHERYDSFLANDLGNLLHRTLSMVEKYFAGKTPKLTEAAYTAMDREVIALFPQTYERYVNKMETFCFNEAIDLTWAFIRRLNKYVGDKVPWTLFKNNETVALENTLRILLEGCCLTAALVSPMMPRTSEEISRQLATPLSKAPLEPEACQFPQLKTDTIIQKGKPLFEKRDA